MTNLTDVKALPPKQFTVKGDDVMLKVIAIGPVKKGKYKYEQPVDIIDIETQEMWTIQYESEYENSMMEGIDVGMTLPFRLKWWESGNGPQISGYTTRSKKKPPASEFAQNAPQRSTGGTPGFGAKMPASAPPNQRKPAFGTQSEGELKKVRGMCRFGFLQALVQNGMKPKDIVLNKMLLIDIECLVDISMNGIKAKQESQEEDLEDWENS